MDITMSSAPFVSIVIPVYNNVAGLRKALEAVRKQSYPAKRYEVIVVDNGSSDDPAPVARESGAVYLEELRYLNSPYSARNRGIEQAKGEIVVLLDATCTPEEGWLEEGVKMLIAGADLAGGNIEFDISPESSLGEIYDSLVNVRMKDSVLKRGVAKTGNLFIKREVFDRIGLFPEGLRSGGDIRWTHRAVREGLKLSYAEKAKAIIKPRGFRALARKQYRVSKGHPAVWKEEGTFMPNFIKRVLLSWLPPSPLKLKRWIDEQNRPYLNKRLPGLFFMGWQLRLISGWGVLVGLLKSTGK